MEYKDRNSKEEIEEDIEFLKDMKEKMDSNQFDYVKSQIEDFINYLKTTRFKNK